MSTAVEGAGRLRALLERAEQIGEAKAAHMRRSIADEAAALPGIRAHVEGEDVILEGRGLLERWLRDASLRNIGRVDP